MLLWSGQIVSTLGTQASTVVYPLLILALTDSPAAAGIAGALGAIPYLLLSLPAGALIDRWDRKRVMILCDIGRGLAVGSIALAILFNMLTVWQVYLVALIDGSLFVLFNIAELVAVTRVVSKEQLPQATGQNEAAFGVVSITAPTFGTFLYGTLGRSAPFIFDAVSYAVSVVSLFFIRVPFQTQRTVVTRNLRAEIAEGLSWLWHQPIIRSLAFLAGSINLTTSSVPLISIVLAKSMGARDAQIGLMFSIAGVGGIFGSLIGGQIQKRFTFGQGIVAVIWSLALLFMLYAIVPHFFLLGVVSALGFMAVTVYNVLGISYRLALIPENLQGRVNSAFRLLAFGFRPLGLALTGFLLERVGAVPTIGMLSLWLVTMALLTTFNTHIRNAPPIEQAIAD
jgi:predicted MFS family arabinose efflux permease